jgi:hypothetical protein
VTCNKKSPIRVFRDTPTLQPSYRRLRTVSVWLWPTLESNKYVRHPFKPSSRHWWSHFQVRTLSIHPLRYSSCDAKLGCIFWQHTSPLEPVPPPTTPPQIFLDQWSLCQMCDGHGLCPVQIPIQNTWRTRRNILIDALQSPPPVATALDAADEEHIHEKHSAVDSCGCIVMR